MVSFLSLLFAAAALSSFSVLSCWWWDLSSLWCALLVPLCCKMLIDTSLYAFENAPRPPPAASHNHAHPTAPHPPTSIHTTKKSTLQYIAKEMKISMMLGLTRIALSLTLALLLSFFWTRNEGPRMGSCQRQHSTAVRITVIIYTTMTKLTEDCEKGDTSEASVMCSPPHLHPGGV